MEEFARKMNIPLHDVICDIEDAGIYARASVPDEFLEDFYAHSFKVYCEGFPAPLPVGTTSIRLREAAFYQDEDHE